MLKKTTKQQQRNADIFTKHLVTRIFFHYSTELSHIKQGY